ncbi:hypothetical protein [Sciscionella marina]|uniref:hypothetical protein n=1 Tax=Sciscionella marina TaxID=508770 RepID=UPI0003723C5D|nr:hypothetical protein [Sciscionella marina]
MGEVVGFMLLRFAMIGGGIIVLLLILGGVVLMLKKTGRFEQAKKMVEPAVRSKLSKSNGYKSALGSKALDYLSEREKSGHQGKDSE